MVKLPLDTRCRRVWTSWGVSNSDPIDVLALVELEDQNGAKLVYSAGSSKNGLLGQDGVTESREFAKISDIAFE